MGLSISKSKFLASRQCDLLLWTHYHARDRIPDPDEGQQFVFETGHRVGDLAKQLYPEGIEIEADQADGRPDIPATLRETTRLLPLRKPLFEASFMADRRYLRADILVPAGKDSWDLIEVKSSSQVKEINLWDVAFQAECLARCGLKLGRLYLMHLDRTYVRQGFLDVHRLFKAVDVTDKVQALLPRVPDLVDQALAVIEGGEPRVVIGPQCSHPYICPLKGRCWGDLPDHPVTEIHRAGKKAFAWMNEGLLTVDLVPAKRLSTIQRIQQKAQASGKPHVDAGAVKRWLDCLEYPVWHLDFETMAPAIPLFDGTHTYQQVPFQFSLHVQDTPGAAPRHIEFLSTETIDPRPGLLEALQAIGPEGTVLAFNRNFEMQVLQELGDLFPAYAAMTRDLRARMMDLADVFSRFQVYHPEQRGRYSLKNVLPAWTDLRYDGLEIRDGRAAGRRFMQAVFPGACGLDEDADRKSRTLKALKAYCGLDTMAMVEILGILYTLI